MVNRFILLHLFGIFSFLIIWLYNSLKCSHIIVGPFFTCSFTIPSGPAAFPFFRFLTIVFISSLPNRYDIVSIFASSLNFFVYSFHFFPLNHSLSSSFPLFPFISSLAVYNLCQKSFIISFMSFGFV